MVDFGHQWRTKRSAFADGGNGINAPVYLLAKGAQTISAPIALNNGHSNSLVSAYTVGVMDASNVTFSGNIVAGTYYNTETSPRNFIVTAAAGGTATFTGTMAGSFSLTTAVAATPTTNGVGGRALPIPTTVSSSMAWARTVAPALPS